MRTKLGIKAWTTNIPLIPQLSDAFHQGCLDYVELFCVPGSYPDTGKAWSSTGLPFVIHAPHSMTGLNFSMGEMAEKNRKLANECFRLADLLKADIVIFHPGVNGSLEETIRQAEDNFDPRMIFENKPLRGLDGSICVGSTPDEIDLLCKYIGVSFCLDFGHAVASANSCKCLPLKLVHRFLELKPLMFHLTDGDYGSELDVHARYGHGNFPLYDFYNLIPTGSFVTNESKRSNSDNIEDYITDREWIETHVDHENCDHRGS